MSLAVLNSPRLNLSFAYCFKMCSENAIERIFLYVEMAFLVWWECSKAYALLVMSSMLYFSILSARP
jgi:hypothetical protein